MVGSPASAGRPRRNPAIFAGQGAQPTLTVPKRNPASGEGNDAGNKGDLVEDHVLSDPVACMFNNLILI